MRRGPRFFDDFFFDGPKIDEELTVDANDASELTSETKLSFKSCRLKVYDLNPHVQNATFNYIEERKTRSNSTNFLSIHFPYRTICVETL